jgi:hypothetical protein
MTEEAVKEVAVSEATRIPLKKHVWDKWIPKKVRIASFEQAGGMLVIRWADWNGGIVSDPQWGKAVPLTGAFPIKIREDGKEVGGFLVNGDKGLAIKYSEDDDLFKMTTTGALAWALLVTQKITDAYTIGLTSREKIIWFMAGFLLMAVMWWLSGA